MYKLKDLPYEYDALEPFIDIHTLALHHKKHQKNYLDKLNALLINNNYDFRYSLEELSQHINEFPLNSREDILFNLGGVVNHDIYFRSMAPKRVEPNTFLRELIDESFSNYDNFKKQFKDKALSLKGSGYTFLVLNNGHLEIINLSNQDNPYYYNFIPLIGLDMWEHAYYLNYQNNKDLYIDNFFNIVNFSEANKLFKIEVF